MRLTYQILFIIALGFILELFLPWWSIAIAGFIGGFFFKSNRNFFAGFIAIALLWFIKAFIQDVTAATALTEKVANIFSLNHKALLFLVTSLIGGIVGGFACLTGGTLKQ